MALRLRSVLVADSINAECAELLRSSGLQVTQAGKMTSQDLIRQLEGHDAVLVRSATQVTAEVIGACPGLKLVGRAGTGVDNIDTEAATRHGVLVMNTPGGNTLSAAEHTCVLITALSRLLPSACASLKAGKWERSKFMGSELNGKTLAVLGLGRIGREVAHRMNAFGMKVIGYDPIISAEAAREFNVEKRELDDIWPEADYITVHTPLIPQTKYLIGAASLARCRRGVRVVNVARGGIVDEAALLAALESGQCGGAGLDVFCQEPPTDLRLVQHPGVICTPHLGASTWEAQLRVARELAQQVVAASRGGSLVGLVNAAGLSGALSPTNRPWVELGQALGAISAPLANISSAKPPVEIEIIVAGPEMDRVQSYLSAAVLLGMMSGTTPNGINLVNAPMMAQEAGITETKAWTEPDATDRRVTVKTTANGATHSVTGTLHGVRPTLLELDGALFESGVTVGGNMLFFQGDGHTQTVVNLITCLSSAHAQIVTVLTSSPNCRGPVIIVRLQEPLSEPELLQTEHAKLLLQASF